MDKREKKCYKCGEVKAVSEFYKDKYSKDGFRYECKECAKQYRQANKEEMKKYKKQYRQANKEEMKKYKKQYYEANKEKIKEYRKKYDNQPKVKAKIKEYNSREEVKKRKQKWSRKEDVVKRRRESQANDVINISDSYAKNLINKQSGNILKAKDIPQELIELKRNNLILKRKIKNNGKEATNL